MKDLVGNTIVHLSQLIMLDLARHHAESNWPMSDADESDRIIKVAADRVATLRQMREEFENAFAGVN